MVLCRTALASASHDNHLRCSGRSFGIVVALASLFSMAVLLSRRQPGRPVVQRPAKVLVVSNDAEEVLRYRTILQKLGCMAHARSFAKGMRCLADEPFDLIFLDEGSSRFEGLDVLARAMEVDTELRVLVISRSYDAGYCFKAMRSGALDYLKGPLTALQISGLVDMFVPRPGKDKLRQKEAAGASAPRPYLGLRCETS